MSQQKSTFDQSGTEFVLYRQSPQFIESHRSRLMLGIETSFEMEKEAMLPIFRWLGFAGKKRRQNLRKAVPNGLRMEQLEDRRLLSVNPVADLANHTNVFTIGIDRQVYQQQYDTGGNLVRELRRTAPGQVKEISAVTLPGGNPMVFAVGLDNQVWQQRFDTNGNPVGAFTLTTPGQVKSVEATATRAGVPLVFVKGLDDQVWVQRFDGNGNSSSGYALTSRGAVNSFVVSGITGYGTNGGGPTVFAIGRDNQVYTQQLDVAGKVVSGYSLTTPGQVKDISFSFATNAFYAIGMDDQVYRLKFDLNGAAAGGYSLTTPGKVKAIEQGRYLTPFVLRPGGFYSTQIFAIGFDDQVYTQKFDMLDNSFQTWTPTAQGAVKQIITWNLPVSTQPTLFAVGMDNQIYEQMFDVGGNSTSGYLTTRSGKIQV